MNCDACGELIDDYCLGAVDEATRESVERHLYDCVTCRRRFESAAAELAPVEPPPRVKSELMARIRLGRPAAAGTARTLPAPPALQDVTQEHLARPAAATRARGLIGPALAVAASLAGAVVGYQVVRLADDPAESIRAAMPIAASPGAGITCAMTSIPGPSGGEPAGGYVAFDELAGQVHICATRLAAQRLHVWLTCGDGSEHELGELRPTADGLAMEVFDLPPLPTPVRSLTIAEMSGGRFEAGLGRPVLTVDMK